MRRTLTAAVLAVILVGLLAAGPTAVAAQDSDIDDVPDTDIDDVPDANIGDVPDADTDDVPDVVPHVDFPVTG